MHVATKQYHNGAKIILWSIFTFETYQKGKVKVGNKRTDLKNFPKLTQSYCFHFSSFLGEKIL